MTAAIVPAEPPATPGPAAGNGRRPPRSLPLRDARDVKRLLARIVNEVRRGDIDARRAGCIGYLCNIFLAAVAAADVDDRIAELERRLGVTP